MRRSFVQQFSELGSGDNVGELMEGVNAVIYFPLDSPSVLLGSHGSSDDSEMYRNVHSVSHCCARAVGCKLTTATDYVYLPDGSEQGRASFRALCKPVRQYPPSPLRTRYSPDFQCQKQVVTYFLRHRTRAIGCHARIQKVAAQATHSAYILFTPLLQDRVCRYHRQD